MILTHLDGTFEMVNDLEDMMDNNMLSWIDTLPKEEYVRVPLQLRLAALENRVWHGEIIGVSTNVVIITED